MKRKFSNGVLLVAAAAALTACSSDDNPWAVTPGEGGISLSLGLDSSVRDALPTRAAEDGSTLFTVPQAEDFSIRLEKTDGSYSHVWPTLADFKNEKSFATGTYTLTAFKGDVKETGVDKPYFVGSTSVTVLEAREAEVSVTAQVANSMVSVEYTEGFKNYLSDYSALIHTEGGEYVPIEGDETQPVFIEPGNIELGFTFTNMQGKQATIYPDEAKFTAAARHHYHVRLDVKGGGVGDAQLSVIFDDSLTQETVTIDLTEELFTAQAPEVKAEGFAAADEIEILEGGAFDSRKRFNVFGRGGLKSVDFTVSCSTFTPGFGSELNLIAATPEQQRQLSDMGVEVRGLFRNPDKIAYIDVTGLAAKLPAGEYTVSVIAKDQLDRASEPVSLKFTIVAPHLEVSASGPALFGTDECEVLVSYNGADPKEDVTFKAQNAHGAYVDCETVSVREDARVRSIESRNYVFALRLPDMSRDVIPMEVYLKGKKMGDLKLQIPVKMPEFTVDGDAFAHKVVLRVNSSDSEKAIVTRNLRVYEGGAQVDNSRISRDEASGFLTVSGFAQQSEHSLILSLTTPDASYAKTVAFTTEAAAQVPNGDFSDVSKTVDFSDVTVGGSYLVGAITYTTHTSFSMNEPDGWASINAKTAYTGSSNKNTWYVVPSTYAENGSVTLRSVAYDNAGAEIATTGKFMSFTYYNPTSANPKSRAAGELFLGSYNFNGTETRVDGISFYSRPSSLTFDYSYSPYGNEQGEAYILVYNQSGSVIAEDRKPINSGANQKAEINLNYPFNEKAAKIAVGFKSTKGDAIGVNIPSGSGLDEGSGLTINATKNYKDCKAVAVGSVLTIDNVTLNYDGAPGAKAAKRGTARKIARKGVRKAVGR